MPRNIIDDDTVVTGRLADNLESAIKTLIAVQDIVSSGDDVGAQLLEIVRGLTCTSYNVRVLMLLKFTSALVTYNDLPSVLNFLELNIELMEEELKTLNELLGHD